MEITSFSTNEQTLMSGGLPSNGEPYATWICVLCAWVYDESAGDPANGIEPGTRWADVPNDWTCPDCGVGKDEFEMVEI